MATEHTQRNQRIGFFHFARAAVFDMNLRTCTLEFRLIQPLENPMSKQVDRKLIRDTREISPTMQGVDFLRFFTGLLWEHKQRRRR